MELVLLSLILKLRLPLEDKSHGKCNVIKMQQVTSLGLGGGGGLEVGNKIAPVLLLLEASEDHLGAGDVLLGVGEIDVQGVLVPGDALVNVGLGVGEASSLTSLSAPSSVKVRSLLVFPTSLHSVTLGTGLGEDLLPVCSAHVC